MAGNVVDFDQFVEQKLNREALADLRVELIAFMRQSDKHAYFAKWALISFAERVCDTPESWSAEWVRLAKDLLTG